MSKAEEAKEQSLEFSQKFALFGRVRYVLKGGTVEATWHAPGVSEAWTVHLGVLNPEPRVSKKRPFSWLIVGALFGLGSLAVAMAAIAATVSHEVKGALVTMLVPFPLTAITSLICITEYVKRSRTWLTFDRVFDGSPGVILRRNKPDPESFSTFVDEVRARIERVQSQTHEGALAAELRGLEQLRNEGKLSDEEYRAARARLLGMEPWQLEQ